MSRKPKPNRKTKNGGFLWGLSLGLACAFGVLVAQDQGWWGTPASSEVPLVTTEAAMTAPAVFLTDDLPKGVSIFVDGKKIEAETTETGLRIPIPGSNSKVDFRNDHGSLWSTRHHIETASSDTLRPKWGGEIVIEVDAQAQRGEVWLDGKPVGQAPGSIDEVPPGWHMLSLRQGDRVLFQDACEVKNAKVTVVRVPPPPPSGKGQLSIRARLLAREGFEDSPGDLVFIDGVNQGQTPLLTNVEAGFHSIRIVRDGFPDFVDVLYVPAGQTKFVDADFGREEKLSVKVDAPAKVSGKQNVAFTVEVSTQGSLNYGEVLLLPEGQAEPISLPLVASQTAPGLWVAVLPAQSVAGQKKLRGYALCRDDQDREGASEIFELNL
ncbi:MAG: PEGA domain-containing protein [Candidatus Eisenbacteria bacterium]|uniref:PEGA domain-containing protein n=1 Tax=Eiseniibacteriota bacterium TaxID=2212470 RepID=A0A7Y2EA08_UNCEI|nr:PEGA domain-containing protein [Candidatus Eisenbacteria bacterium]